MNSFYSDAGMVFTVDWSMSILMAAIRQEVMNPHWRQSASIYRETVSFPGTDLASEQTQMARI